MNEKEFADRMAVVLGFDGVSGRGELFNRCVKSCEAIYYNGISPAQLTDVADELFAEVHNSDFDWNESAVLGIIERIARK